MGLKEDFKDISAIKILVFWFKPVIVNSFKILSQNAPDKIVTNQFYSRLHLVSPTTRWIL